MYRYAYEDLKEWQRSADRRPLILRGPRQVGKTWLLQEFGKNEYQSVAYVNLERNVAAANLFDIDLDPKRIVAGLENLLNIKITPTNTLIIIDEIQSVPRAITALKYFCEEAPEYHIAVAGSLLGISLHENVSFPVGKVNFLDLYPMNFCEFLMATNKNGFATAIRNHEYAQLTAFHDNIIDSLKHYFIVGGMPKVVADYAAQGNLLNTRNLQSEILESYEQDFSKHAPTNVVPRLREIYQIAPAELAKENKKFIFNLIRQGARAKDYDAALLWLEDTGLAERVLRVNSANLPLSAYADQTIFKMFLSDIGLLAAKSEVPIEVVLNGDKMFVEFKGALTEQFVFQELKCAGIKPYYYHNDNTNSEVDFIIQKDGAPLPIEVKSGTNLAARSLDYLLEKYRLSQGVKLSPLPYAKNDRITNLPLYLAGEL